MIGMFWIPAFAGMTVVGRSRGMESVIPGPVSGIGQAVSGTGRALSGSPENAWRTQGRLSEGYVDTGFRRYDGGRKSLIRGPAIAMRLPSLEAGVTVRGERPPTRTLQRPWCDFPAVRCEFCNRKPVLEYNVVYSPGPVCPR